MIATLIVCMMFSLLAIAVSVWCCRFKWRVKIVFLPFGAAVSIAALAIALYIAKYLFFGGVLGVSKVLSPGLVYSREVIRDENAVVHWLEIDLAKYRIIQVAKVAEDNRLQAELTTQALDESNGLAAINGSFFHPFKDQHLLSYYPHIGDPVTPMGFTKIGERVVNEAKNNWPLLVISAVGNPAIVSSAEKLPEFEFEYVLAGRSLLIVDGVITAANDAEPYPRASIGLSADKKFAYFVVVDGKQPGYSNGLSLHRLAELMVKRSIVDAIELDGGGSSTLAAKEGGSVKLLNRPAHIKLPGRERPVANQLLVIARD